MKKYILLTVSILLINFTAHSQANNPFNEMGIKTSNAVNLLANDFKDGKIKDYSQKTISTYQNLLGIETQIPEQLIPNIYNTLKDKDFNYVNFINNTKLTGETKTQMLNLIKLTKDYKDNELRDKLILKVDELKLSDLPQAEKDMLLYDCAALYNSSNSISGNLLNRGNDNGNGPTGNQIGSVAGMIIGGYMGMTLCGLPCCFIGSAVGLFLGGIIGERMS